MDSLREELGLPPIPDFELDIPPGWQRRDASAETQADMERQLRRKLMAAHRPDLMAILRTELQKSFRSMKQHRVIAHFSPAEDVPGISWLPLSLVARHRFADANTSLDDIARGLITQQGATPLDGNLKILRAVRESKQTEGDTTVTLVTVTYLIPVPTTEKRVALEFTGSYPRPGGEAADGDYSRQMQAVLDACVSSIRWLKPAEV